MRDAMATSKPNPKTGRKDDLERPWVAGDAIPVPDAVHRAPESGWALWNEVAQQHEARFAETAPMSGPAGMDAHDQAWATTLPAGALAAKAVPRRPPQPLFTLEGAMIVARRNNRVCPRPERWNAFSELLPARKTLRGVQAPPAPVTGPAWAVTPSLSKRLCFREQIEWAEREGVLESVMAFMQGMSEEDWLHMGED